jgi:hypothetical protein
MRVLSSRNVLFKSRLIIHDISYLRVLDGAFRVSWRFAGAQDDPKLLPPGSILPKCEPSVVAGETYFINIKDSCCVFDETIDVVLSLPFDKDYSLFPSELRLMVEQERYDNDSNEQHICYGTVVQNPTAYVDEGSVTRILTINSTTNAQLKVCDYLGRSLC